MARVGGVLYVAANGVRIPVRGSWNIGRGLPKRDGVVGVDGVHGYKEMPQLPFIEGEATVTPDMDVDALLQLQDATITAELANGKTPVLRNAWQAAEGVIATEEGTLPLRFEGLSMDYT